MSHKKQNPPVATGDSAGVGLAADVNSFDYSRITLRLSSPKSRRLSAQEGALLKLDFVEAALQRARSTGDDSAWVGYYQAWLCLHALAFGYGKFSGAADV